MLDLFSFTLGFGMGVGFMFWIAVIALHFESGRR
jgi:hypothetical protein